MLRKLIALGALALLLGMAAVAWHSGRPAAPTRASVADAGPVLPLVQMPMSDTAAASYLGDAACRKCHLKEFGAHSRSPHARTLQRVTPDTVDAEFENVKPHFDPGLGIKYAFLRDGDSFFLEASQEQNRMRGRLDLALGAGVNAKTYLYRPTAETFVQLRMSWFRRAHRWDYTPKLEAPEANPTPLGSLLDLQAASECLGCHSTTLVTDRSGQHLDLDRSQMNVGCERCHGPGKEHVAALQRRDPTRRMQRLATLSSGDLNRICGQCHLPQTGEKDQPTILAVTGETVPSASMSRSQCYIRTNGALRCTSCHNAHTSLEKNESSYNRVCLSCHQPNGGQAREQCPVNPTAGCTGCHMPRQRVNNHFQPPTHWIKVYAGIAEAASSREQQVTPGVLAAKVK